MDDFRDTTRTNYSSGGKVFAKGGKVTGPRGAAGEAKHFAQFKRGSVPAAKAGPTSPTGKGFAVRR